MTASTKGTRRGRELMASAQRVADRCADAYSWDRYASWTACAAECLALGFSEAETEEILRSKYMRWAGDCYATPKHRYGRYPAHFIGKYLRRDFALRGEASVRREIAGRVTPNPSAQ